MVPGVPLAICVPVPGTGSETFIRRHVEGLGPVAIVARRAGDAWATGLPTLWLDDLAAEWGGAAELAATRDFLGAHGVTAVLAEYLDVWVDLLPALAAGGRRVVARGLGYDISMRLREPWWVDRYREWANADAIVTVSEIGRRRLLDAVPLAEDLVLAAPCGVEVPAALPPRPPSATIRCLAAGRLVAKKAPHLTAAAFALAARDDPRLRLSMVGDGPLRATVDAVGAPLERLGTVAHEDLKALMRGADLFLQHSVVDPETGDEEGLPVAILEAMAHGLPVVATRHAGIPEAVVHGETGLLVEEGDVGAMAAAIARLAADPDERERMGAAGHARALERFSVEAELAALREVLGP
jgi:glycosyltransferase involved in cell wall biosynthesis